MHELKITAELIDQISSRLVEHGSPKVKRVVLEIGVFTAILPDAVRFSFDLCAQGSIVEGAILEIIEVSAFGDCNRCGKLVETKILILSCECGNAEIHWKRGQELKIKEVEVEY